MAGICSGSTHRYLYSSAWLFIHETFLHRKPIKALILFLGVLVTAPVAQFFLLGWSGRKHLRHRHRSQRRSGYESKRYSHQY